MWSRFGELVSAGDFGDHVEGDVGWWRRAAKSLLESDRMMQLVEKPTVTGAGEGGYIVKLCKMEPLEASPKNDIIVAWGKKGADALEGLFGVTDKRAFNIPGCKPPGRQICGFAAVVFAAILFGVTRWCW